VYATKPELLEALSGAVRYFAIAFVQSTEPWPRSVDRYMRYATMVLSE
jgi:hypothetical protein